MVLDRNGVMGFNNQHYALWLCLLWCCLFVVGLNLVGWLNTPAVQQFCVRQEGFVMGLCLVGLGWLCHQICEGPFGSSNRITGASHGQRNQAFVINKKGTRFGFSRSWCLLWMLGSLRVGEASHPGPEEWILGTFNPSGVAHRVDIITSLPGNLWGVSETHLSPVATRQFVRGLQCAKAPYKNVIPGYPCPIRARSETAGDFTGVAAISTGACRALPHSFSQDLYETSRIQVVGALVQQVWITAGLIYGYPKSNRHQHPRFQTDVLLEALVDRIGAQTSGPRVIMGDFNWEPHELSQVARLQEMGFVELQDLAAAWWGQPIQPTGRGSTRIDCVFVSRELACLLKQVVVDPTQWPDHSMVYGVFESPSPIMETFHWRMPKSCEWPKNWDPDYSPDFAQGASYAYAEFWNALEQSASQAVTAQGKTAWSPAVVGRGQTLEPVKSHMVPSPIRKSRQGEISPQFYGPSFRFAQQFKQARRLQAYVNLVRKGSVNNDGQIAALWSCIRHSSGFPGGFCAWFATLQCHECQHEAKIPCFPPGVERAAFIFDIVQSEVQRFEKHLITNRVKIAKGRRAHDLKYVFNDCARDQPQKVAMLVNTVVTQVVEVDEAMQSIVVDPPLDYKPDTPLMHQGRKVDVIHPEPDCLWVDNVGEFLQVMSFVKQGFKHQSMKFCSHSMMNGILGGIVKKPFCPPNGSKSQPLQLGSCPRLSGSLMTGLLIDFAFV